MILLHVVQILKDRIRRSGIPFTVRTLFIRRKNCYAAFIPVKIPRDTDADMRIQPQRLVLRQNSYCVYPGINTVAQREIDDTVLPATAGFATFSVNTPSLLP